MSEAAKTTIISSAYGVLKKANMHTARSESLMMALQRVANEAETLEKFASRDTK